ncbi:unnamed protein product [Pipistrellus nathusii]|uniref:Uncharacterized protein n=1 Tax=Pipistrellus nathusii TaxID=59473 RepID=A0ABP0AG33_PIPNA
MLHDGVASSSVPRMGMEVVCLGASKLGPCPHLTSAFIHATSLPLPCLPLPTSSSPCASVSCGKKRVEPPRRLSEEGRGRGRTRVGFASPSPLASHRRSSQGRGEEGAGSVMSSFPLLLLLSHVSHLSCPLLFPTAVYGE